jgi:hypothetical protein
MTGKKIILLFGLLFSIGVFRSQGLNKFNCGDTLILSVTGDTALEVTSIFPVNGIMKINFVLYSKNNNKDINFLNVANQSAPYKENVPLASLIPLDIIKTYHLRYFAGRLPNDTLENGDIKIKTTILKQTIGEIDKKHNDTVYYCKIKQQIRYFSDLLYERTETTALMYKSLETHFGIKLYKWYCRPIEKYIISIRFYKTTYDKKTDRYKSKEGSRILFT